MFCTHFLSTHHFPFPSSKKHHLCQPPNHKSSGLSQSWSSSSSLFPASTWHPHTLTPDLLGLYESSLCCFFSFVVPSDSMCSIPPQSPLPLPTSPIRVLQSASVSLHWMTAPWGSHSSPSETGLDKSVMPLEPPRPFALSVTVIRTANQVHSKSPSFSKQPPVSEPCGSKRSGTLVPVLFSVHPKLEEGGGEE